MWLISAIGNTICAPDGVLRATSLLLRYITCPSIPPDTATVSPTEMSDPGEFDDRFEPVGRFARGNTSVERRRSCIGGASDASSAMNGLGWAASARITTCSWQRVMATWKIRRSSSTSSQSRWGRAPSSAPSTMTRGHSMPLTRWTEDNMTPLLVCGRSMVDCSHDSNVARSGWIAAARSSAARSSSWAGLFSCRLLRSRLCAEEMSPAALSTAFTADRLSPVLVARPIAAMSSQNLSHFVAWRSCIASDASRRRCNVIVVGKLVELATPLSPRLGLRMASRTSERLALSGAWPRRIHAKRARTIDRLRELPESSSWVGMPRSTSAAFIGIRLAFTRVSTAMSCGSTPLSSHAVI